MLVSPRMHVDVVEDLKRVAPLKCTTGYQAPIEFSVGMGLRRDLEKLWLYEVPERLQGILEKHGFPDDIRDDLLEELLGIVPHQRIVEKDENRGAAIV